MNSFHSFLDWINMLNQYNETLRRDIQSQEQPDITIRNKGDDTEINIKAGKSLKDLLRIGNTSNIGLPSIYNPYVQPKPLEETPFQQAQRIFAPLKPKEPETPTTFGEALKSMAMAYGASGGVPFDYRLGLGNLMGIIQGVGIGAAKTRDEYNRALERYNTLLAEFTAQLEKGEMDYRKAMELEQAKQMAMRMKMQTELAEKTRIITPDVLGTGMGKNTLAYMAGKYGLTNNWNGSVLTLTNEHWGQIIKDVENDYGYYEAMQRDITDYLDEKKEKIDPKTKKILEDRLKFVNNELDKLSGKKELLQTQRLEQQARQKETANQYMSSAKDMVDNVQGLFRDVIRNIGVDNMTMAKIFQDLEAGKSIKEVVKNRVNTNELTLEQKRTVEAIYNQILDQQANLMLMKRKAKSLGIEIPDHYLLQVGGTIDTIASLLKKAKDVDTDLQNVLRKKLNLPIKSNK